MARVATRRLKIGGQWYKPGSELPNMKAADFKALAEAGYATEQVTAQEAAQAQQFAARVAALQEKRSELEAGITEREARLTELGEAVDLAPLQEAAKGKDATDEAKAALKAAREANAERERVAKEIAAIRPQLDEAAAALKLLG